jgi:hypothetical protein
MRGDVIPDKNHISRYCKATQVADGQVQSTAFMLRAGKESLSVNWLEFLKCSSRDGEIGELQRISASKLSVGARAKIAVLNVGEVRKKVRRESPDGRNINVLHDPEAQDPSHSGIYDLKQDDELIAELIREIIRETYPARTEK